MLNDNHMTTRTLGKDIISYNTSQKGDCASICDSLAELIVTHFKSTESKVWHGGPVWFIDGNPIVGYWVRKNDSVQLLFWSGQSFEEEGLEKEGSFKAAEKRYTHVNEIKKGELKRWLKKAEKIQWDYKNIVKRKGVLKRLR